MHHKAEVEKQKAETSNSFSVFLWQVWSCFKITHAVWSGRWTKKKKRKHLHFGAACGTEIKLETAIFIV